MTAAPSAAFDTPQVRIESSIKALTTRFYFHDRLRSSSGFSNHFIVEDLQNDASYADDAESQFFYYLKQTVYTSKPEYLQAMSYAQKLYQYGKAKFCKSDMIKLHYIFFHESESRKSYELVTVFDYGEPDRIDLDVIEFQHISKFLRNICSLLAELKKFDGLYHSNIEVPNIVLVNSELKISGFKSRYILNQGYNSWKVQLIRRFGHFRLDLFLIGLLWMKFLKVPEVDRIDREATGLDDVLERSRALVDKVTFDHRSEIVKKLVDVEAHPAISVDDVLIFFDETAVLENIHNSAGREQAGSPAEGPLKIQFPLEYPTFEKFELHTSGSRDSNLFLRPYRESFADLHAEQNSVAAKPDKEAPQMLVIDREFTLKHEDSVRNFEETHDDLIDVKDGKNPRGSDELGMDGKGLSLAARNFSQKNLALEASHYQTIRSLRKLKSDQKLTVYDEPTEGGQDPVQLDVKKKLEQIEEVRESIIYGPEVPTNFKKKSLPNESQAKPEPEAKAQGSAAKEAPKNPPLAMNKLDSDAPRPPPKPQPKTDVGSRKKVETDPKPKRPEPSELDQSKAERERDKSKEKERLLKQKIDKKLAENLEKKKQEKQELVKRASEIVKSKREHDSREGSTLSGPGSLKDLSHGPERSPSPVPGSLKVMPQPPNKPVSPSPAAAKPAPPSPLPAPTPLGELKKPEKDGSKSTLEELNKRLAKGLAIAGTTAPSPDRPKPAPKDRESTRSEKEPGSEYFDSVKDKKKAGPDSVKKPHNQSPSSKKELPLEKKHSTDFKKKQPEFDSLKVVPVGSSKQVSAESGSTKSGQSSIKRIALEAYQSPSEIGQKPDDFDSQRSGPHPPSASGKSSAKTLESVPEEPPKVPGEPPKPDSVGNYATPSSFKSLPQDLALPANPQTEEVLNVFGYQTASQNTSKDTINFNTSPANPANNSFFHADILESQFKHALPIVRTLFLEENFGECLELLKQFAGLTNPNRAIEYNKLRALVLFKMRRLEEAKEELFGAMRVLQVSEAVDSPREVLQSILTNIAIIEFESNNFEEVLEILQNKIFEADDSLSRDHFQMLADSYFQLGLFTAAFFNYDRTLQVLMVNDLHPSDLELFKTIGSRIVTCLSHMNEAEVILKFIASAVEILNKYKPMLGKKDEARPRVVEGFIHATVRLVASMGKKDQLLAVLEHLYDDKSLSPGMSFEDQEVSFLLDCVGVFVWERREAEASPTDAQKDLDPTSPSNSPPEAPRADPKAKFRHPLAESMDRKDPFAPSLMAKDRVLKMVKVGKFIAGFYKEEDRKNEATFAFLWRKATLLMKLNELEKAQKAFEKASVLEASLDSPLQAKFHVALFNVGVCCWRLGRLEEASFYFDKVLIDPHLEQATEVRAMKILSRIYFRLGIHRSCKAILDDLMSIDLAHHSFLKYLGMYFVCCDKLGWDSAHEKFAELFEASVRANQDKSLKRVCALLMVRKAVREKDLAEAERLLGERELWGTGEDDRESSIIVDMTRLELYLTQKEYAKAASVEPQLTENVVEEHNRSKEKVPAGEEAAPPSELPLPDNLHNFLLNLRFLLLARSEVRPETIGDRQAMINDLLTQKEALKLFDGVYDFLKEQSLFLNSLSFASEPRNLNFTDAKAEPSQYLTEEKRHQEHLEKSHHTAPKSGVNESQMETLRNELYKQIMRSEVVEPPQIGTPPGEPESERTLDTSARRVVRRMKSTELLARSNTRRSKCFCFEFNRANPELDKLVREFMAGVKAGRGGAPLFLRQVVELKEKVGNKKLRFLKYGYLKLLSRLVHKAQTKGPIDPLELGLDFEEILGEKDLCFHDVRRILGCLEAVQTEKRGLMDQFLGYLDGQHKGLMKAVVSQKLLPGYLKRYSAMVSQLFERGYNSPKNYARSFPLIHYLADQEEGFERGFVDTEPLERPRLGFLADQCNFFVCNKYVPSTQLIAAYISAEVVALVAGLVALNAPKSPAETEAETDSDDPNQSKATGEAALLTDFVAALKSIAGDFGVASYSNRFFMYEVFGALFYLKRLDSTAVANAVFDALIYLESHIMHRDLYHFAIACSLTGDLFFAQQEFDHCLKVKQMSHIVLRRINEVELIFPPYLPQIDPNQLMFHILAYNVVSNIELDKPENAREVLAKMKLIKFSSKAQVWERKLVETVFETLYGKFAAARGLLGELRDELWGASDGKKTREMYGSVLEALAAFMEQEKKR